MITNLPIKTSDVHIFQTEEEHFGGLSQCLKVLHEVININVLIVFSQFFTKWKKKKKYSYSMANFKIYSKIV